MRRPVAVTVLGILNIVFAALGIIGILISVAVLFSGIGGPGNPAIKAINDQPGYATWLKLSAVIGTAGSAALLVAGIGLLLLKPWARTLTIVYAVYAILGGILGLAMNYIYLVQPIMEKPAGRGPEAAAEKVGAIGGTFGGCIGFIYPIVLLVFMARSDVKAAFRPAGHETEPPDEYDPGAP
jgi:hypothetical protein